MSTTSDRQFPTFLPGDPVCDVLFSGASALRNRDKQYKEGPIEVLPGIYSNDYEFLTFKDKLSTLLTQKFPESVDELGRVYGNGVRSNFFGMRHVGGYPMLPATFPLVDNSYLREKEGLLNGFEKPWHEVVLRSLVRLFFTGLTPEPMKLRRGSSSMMPFFTKEMLKKEELARFALHSAEKGASMMMKGDYVTPWTTMHLGGAYQTVYRRQSTDAISLDKGVYTSKPRPVADAEYALSGGRKGTFSPADKSFKDVDFKVPSGFFRERNRTAKGGPLGMNACLMPVAQALRSHIYKDYAYTFHHTTRDSIQKDVREFVFSIAADVSNHDWFWPTFILDTICDELRNIGYADWWVHLYMTKSKLADYVTDVGPGLGNVLFGDWRKPNNKGGLPSGNAFTDIEGTICMTWVYFLIQVEHTYPEIIPRLTAQRTADSLVDQYLRGHLPIRLKDKSDDAILGWSDRHLIPKAMALQEKMRDKQQISPYMLVSYEHGGAFLGSILLYPMSKEHKDVLLIGNISSYLTNMFSPEYGIQSNIRDRSKTKRPYGGLAWRTMSQNYGSCPIYGDVKEIVEHTWSKVYGYSYNHFRDTWLREDEKALADHLRHSQSSGLPDLTPIEVEVLADPSKLDWKYDVKDVHPSILASMFKGLPLSDVEPYFSSIFR